MNRHYEMRYKTDYIGKLHEIDGQCTEIVFYLGQQIHRAEFPASFLGGGNRGEYLRCMVSSIAFDHVRGRLVASNV